MTGSALLVPLCGAIAIIGLVLGSVLAAILYRVLLRRSSITGTLAVVASAGCGVAAFATWFVLAWSALVLLATIFVNET